MKKTASFTVFAACAFLLLFSANCSNRPQSDSATPSPDEEMRIKQSLLQQDVKLTEQLCRNQCYLDLYQLHRQLNNTDPENVKRSLDKFRAEHEHMEYIELVEIPSMRGLGETGQVPEDIKEKADSALDQARESIKNGKNFESETFGEGEKRYMAMGLINENGTAGIVSLVHQDILHKVEVDLRKNLRIVPYPSDKRYKIESVDSDTLEDVKVNHPEQNEGTSHYHVNQVVVKFRTEPSDEDLAQIQKDLESRTVKKLGYTYVFESSRMDAKQMMQYFQNWNVEYAEPHFLYMTNESANQPNDMLYARYQWNLPAIDTLPGWDVSKGSSDVLVAVIDTGVDLDHLDLQNRVVQGLNVIDPEKPPIDDVGHGTHVAGVISALVNNEEGVAGISWYNNILPVKVLDETGAGSTYSVAQGIIWATDQGAKVINMSLGNYAEAKFLHDAIRYAFDRDVVLIAASGNDNTEQPGYPAAYPEVFAVAATDAEGRKAPFSNYGDYIDVAAPGVSIASTYPGNHYAALSGTSMASPHVTALAALIRSANPQLTNLEVMDIMRQTATDLGEPGKDIYFGYGQIDIARALAQAVQEKRSLTFWEKWFERELDSIAKKYKRQ
jgi:subtilisin family serine protease